MASKTSNAATHSAQVVANAFVEQYYIILLTSPKMVNRFYKDSSMLSRRDANGKMSTVATLQEINEKILSLNFEEYKAEIKTADAQKSHMGGVTMLVTGILTGKVNSRKSFAQSFFLAPQDDGDNSYFVLNDVFTYVDDNKPVPILDPEPSHVSDPSAPEPSAFMEAIDAAESDERIPSKNETVAKSLPSRRRSWIRPLPIAKAFRVLLHGK